MSQAVQTSIKEHECLKYRHATPELAYEHEAMALELLRRMRVSARAAGVGAVVAESKMKGDDEAESKAVAAGPSGWTPNAADQAVEAGSVRAVCAPGTQEAKEPARETEEPDQQAKGRRTGHHGG